MEKNSTKLGLKIIVDTRNGEKFIISEENITETSFWNLHHFECLLRHFGDEEKEVVRLWLKKVFTNLREKYGDDENEWNLIALRSRKLKTDIVRNLTLQEYCCIGQLLKTCSLFYNKKKKKLVQ